MPIYKRGRTEYLMQKEKKANSMDMIHGSLWNKILLFALPLAASSILQQLFNSVDTAVVGRFASSQALAAVGSNSSLISLMINLFLGVSLGSNVVIAHYIGQGSEKNIKAAVHTAMLVAVLCGFFVLLFGQVIARPVLLLMGTPEDVIDLAVLYLRIYLLGMPCIMLYDFGASILRSTGDSKRPLYALIAAGIINTILNLILVISFGMGVSGVAIATVISNMVSSGIVLYILLHEQDPIRVELKQLSIVPKELKKIVNAFAQTTVTFTSQNYGAGEVDRCKKVFRLNMVFSLVFCGMLSAIFVLGRGFFLRLYTTDEAVLVFAAQRLLIVTTLELLTSTYEISAGAMRGLGHSLLPAIITCVGSCLLRLVWIATACRLVHDFGLLMIIYPISWVITGTAMLTAYFCIRKKCFKSLGRF